MFEIVLGLVVFGMVVVAVGIFYLVLSIRKELQETLGQWQYLESVSTVADRFLQRLDLIKQWMGTRRLE